MNAAYQNDNERDNAAKLKNIHSARERPVYDRIPALEKYVTLFADFFVQQLADQQ